MALRVKCDRGKKVFDPIEDDKAAQLSISQMTRDWDIEGSIETVGDLCGDCIEDVKEFMSNA